MWNEAVYLLITLLWVAVWGFVGAEEEPEDIEELTDIPNPYHQKPDTDEQTISYWHKEP